MKYTLRYVETPKGFVGHLVEMPGVVSQAKTMDELKSNIKDALEVTLEIMREESEGEMQVMGWETSKTTKIEL